MNGRRRALLALAVMLACGAARASDDAPARPRKNPALALLEAVPQDDALAHVRAVDALAKLSWTDLLAGIENPGDDRDGLRTGALRDALARGGPPVTQELFGVATQPEARAFVRLIALQHAARRDVDVRADAVLGLARAAGEAEREGPIFSAVLRDAVAACLKRHAGDARSAAAAWEDLSSSCRLAVLDGIEDAGSAGGDHAFGIVLASARTGTDEILDRLSRTPWRRATPIPTDAQDAVDAALGSDDVPVRAAAALVAGRLGGPARAARLHALLADPNSTVVAAARRGLETATGSPLCADPQLWATLISSERTWRDHDAADALAGLRNDDAAAATAVVAGLAGRRLHGDLVAPRIAELLRGPDAGVRAAACTALGRLGNPSVIPALAHALDDPAGAVAAAASSALAAITGLPRPADPRRWKQELAVDAR